MYESMFELTRRPFSSTVDTEGYFASPRHEAALALMQGCVTSGDGVGVLTGPTGTGKTLVSHLLLDSLEANFATIFVTNTHPTDVASFYQAMLYDLSVPYDETNEQTLRLRLIDHLVRRFAAGERTLLMIDEAHHLTVDQLEELRMLTNLEGRQDRAVQVLLFGGNGLLTTLRRGELEPLRQRVAAFARLEPLDAEQTVEYIRCRIGRAGGAADTIFSAGALSEICERSGGVPRRINQLCHRAMLNAWQNRSGAIDTLDIVEAAEQLEMAELPTVDKKAGKLAPAAASVRPTGGERGFGDNVRNESVGVGSSVEVGAGIATPIYSPLVEGKNAMVESRVDKDALSMRSKESQARSNGLSRLRQLYSK